MENHETKKSMNSIEDDWDYLDQVVAKRVEGSENKESEDHEIPVESALDEIDEYVEDTIIIAANSTEQRLAKTEVDMENNTTDKDEDLLTEIDALDEMLSLAKEGGVIDSKEEEIMTLEEFDALLGETQSQVQEEGSMPKTASDIFSDSLGAVSSLEDQLLEEQFNSLLSDNEPEKQQDNSQTLMHKMFANIEPENPEAEIAAMQEAETKKEAEKKKKAKDKQAKKQEKQKAAADKKAAKAAEKERKAKLKAEAKEKKRKEKEELEKTYVPEGKINKIGASIVAGVAAVIGIAIIVASLKGTYHLTLNNAQFDAGIGRYSQAYEALSGLNLKGEDQELYNKVKTIMYMDKQQKSYENFMELGMPVEALDSLLKGLNRYEEYYEQAVEYGVTDQFDKKKTELLSVLKQSYQISENEAKSLIAQTDKTVYTETLVKLCGESEK